MMSKAILLSIKPNWVAKILNGEKTIEIRKRFPKDYRGLVYIYCSKGNKKGWCMVGINGNETYYQKYDKDAVYSPSHNYIGNRKVVARFWCDNVEHFEYDTCSRDICGYWLDNGQIFKNKGTCLSADELWNYIKGKDGYAIHISKLEIFDEPKELSEFRKQKYLSQIIVNCEKPIITCVGSKIEKAPQSYCFIDGEIAK